MRANTSKWINYIFAKQLSNFAMQILGRFFFFQKDGQREISLVERETLSIC